MSYVVTQLPKTKAQKRTRMSVRHFCRKCNMRVYPFDRFEHNSIAPVHGKRQEEILLESLNTAHPDERIAWCWRCNAYRRVIRLTEDKFIEFYLNRKGVRYREGGWTPRTSPNGFPRKPR